MYLGLSHSGLLTFQGSRKTQHFRWSEVQRLNYEGKMFIVHITIMEVRRSGHYLFEGVEQTLSSDVVKN